MAIFKATSLFALLVLALAISAAPAFAQKSGKSSTCKAGTHQKCMDNCVKTGGGSGTARGGVNASCARRCSNQGCT